MSSPLALIIDDEPDIRELLEITLKRMDVESRCAVDLGEARELLRKERFDLCLTDIKLPDGNGIEFVSYIQQHYPSIPVAVITAHGNMESAIQALKSGAYDFITKPVDLAVLRALVNNALSLSQQKAEPASDLIGDSEAMKRTRATIAKLARSQAPIYISGESGTGKELVARMIHEQGPRAGKPFAPVNCGAIPPDLMESEFFGHRKGSFTGAVSDKDGLFQAAQGGTLFLDEVGELPLHMQVKLLRAIQEKSIRPVGAQKELPVDVRILSATHKDLGALVAKGEFRQDLFYRINVIELHVPPLRERTEDIPPLVDYILIRLAEKGGTDTPSLSPDALQALQAYRFPGNVRELENILERAMTLCDRNLIKRGDLQLPAETRSDSAPEKSAALEPYLEQVEKDKILNALEQTRWNKTAAARLLGISFGALRYRLQKLGLD
ncbi:MAG: sigma-54 dependent transcriptional regulator [Gammaproteobacteria bacterium]|nr:sigma-54 dependent transcriptional regulator [Gammaproteobacteria bacterium]MCI0590723.1 sigma-54 dependent transcriptional regulator [Gammaproteobacteria bacterium]